MSLVGTRPPTVDEWELYEPHHRAKLEKRDALRQKKLLDTIAQSGRSYKEIMQYLHSKSEEV